MIESAIDRLIDVLSNEITDKLKQAIKDKQELETFQDNLQHWIQEFISKNETTIINSSEFSHYIEYYNIIGRIVEYITAYEPPHIDEKMFINSEIEKIIEFLKDNNKAIASTDRTVIKDFVNGIFNNIKNHFF